MRYSAPTYLYDLVYILFNPQPYTHIVLLPIPWMHQGIGLSFESLCMFLIFPHIFHGFPHISYVPFWWFFHDHLKVVIPYFSGLYHNILFSFFIALIIMQNYFLIVHLPVNILLPLVEWHEQGSFLVQGWICRAKTKIVAEIVWAIFSLPAYEIIDHWLGKWPKSITC